ncbi:MAG: hypothetical protein AAF934_03720 [Bacteroidota bacterium]
MGVPLASLGSGFPLILLPRPDSYRERGVGYPLQSLTQLAAFSLPLYNTPWTLQYQNHITNIQQ